jgi:hypothetical protein
MDDKSGYLFSVLKLIKKKTGNQGYFLPGASEQGKGMRLRKKLSGLSLFPDPTKRMRDRIAAFASDRVVKVLFKARMK